MKKILSFMAIAMILMGLSACSGGAKTADAADAGSAKTAEAADAGSAETVKPSTPETAVTTVLNGMKSGDIKAVASACCDSQGKPSELELSGDQIKAANDKLKEMFSGLTYTITNTEISEDGNNAVVTFTGSVGGNDGTETFKCIKGEDGKWRVKESSLPNL